MNFLRYIVLTLASVFAWQAGRDARSEIGSPTSAAGTELTPRQQVSIWTSQALEIGRINVAQAPSSMRVLRQALRAEPLLPDALAWIALGASAASNDGASHLLVLGERVSRRSTLIQLASLQRSMVGRDLVGSLAHLDRLLRIGPGLGATMFPALLAALDEPGGPRLVEAYSARPWFRAFALYAVNEAASIAPVADLLVSSMERGSPPDDTVLSRMLARLCAEGEMDVAKRFAVVYGKATDDTFATRELKGASLDQRFAPLSWAIGDDAMLISFGEGRTGVGFELAPSGSQELMRRVTALATGRYRIEQVARMDSGQGRSQAAWRLSCFTRGGWSRSWEQVFDLGTGESNHLAEVTVPAGCAIQQWQLVALGDDQQFSAKYSIESLRIADVG